MPNALITGASRGIGKEIALQAKTQGYQLALLARNTEALTTLFSAEHTLYNCDLRDEAQIATFTSKLKSNWNAIDLLVLNAGIFIPGKLLHEHENQFIKQWELNVLANYRLIRSFFSLLKNSKKAHIFIIGSIAGLAPRDNAGSYSSSKAAVHMLAKAFREELKADHIKVTLILPGATYTSSWEGVDIPKSTFVQPEDIAKAIFNIVAMSDAAVVEEIIIQPIQSF